MIVENKPNYYIGTITYVESDPLGLLTKDRLYHEAVVAVPGVFENVLAFPARTNIDEPKVGDLVVVCSWDPVMNSYCTYEKLKEDDFVGFRAHGKMVQINHDKIVVGVFDETTEYKDPDVPDVSAIAHLEMDKDGNITVHAAQNITVNGDADCTITIKGNNTVTINGNNTVKIDGDSKLEVGGNLDAKVSGDLSADISGNLDAKVNGDISAETSGNLDAKVSGNMNAEVSGNLEAKVIGNMNTEISGNLEAKAIGNISAETSGNLDIKSSGNVNIMAGESAKIECPDVTITGGKLTVKVGQLLLL